MTIRTRNLNLLNSFGFSVAASLPTVRSNEGTTLRPVNEIAQRLAALAGLFLWAAEGADDIPSDEIQKYVDDNELRDALTVDELAILDLDRNVSIERFTNTIGWRLENMWSLAWILGFEPQPALFGMIENDTIDRMLFEFLRCPRDTVSEVVMRAVVRPLDVVDEMEDLFYCAHNAVRSAQLGGATVPPEFDPLLDGGGIHERRHALTWALSPAETWDETDLST